MNFKTTLTLIILLALMGGYFYFVERHATTSRPSEQPLDTRMDDGFALFTADELSTEAINHVVIQRGDDKYVFHREGTDWYQVEPIHFKLNGWQLRSIIDQAATVTQFQTLNEPASPSFFASITMANTNLPDATHTLHLGDTTIAGRAKLKREGSNDLLLVNDTLHKRIRNLNIADLRQKTFDTPTAAQTHMFTVEREGETLSLYKFDSQWYLDEKQAQRADANEVESLIETFGRLSIDQFIEDAPNTPDTPDTPTNLDVFGLNKPSTTLTLTTPDRTLPSSATVVPGERIVFKIGRPTNLASDAFFATRSTRDHDAQVVFKVSQATLDPFNASPDSLRDSRLFTTTAPNVQRFIIDRGDESLQLERDQGDVYAFSDPKPSFTADYNATTDLIDAILALKADRYETNFTPTDEPTFRISVNHQAVAFYDEAEGYWAIGAGESVAYHINKAAIQPMIDTNTRNLRNRTILALQRNDLLDITLKQADGTTLHFSRDDNAWSLTGHDTFEQEAFDALIASLTPLRADHWPAPAPGTPAPGNIRLGNIPTLTLQTTDNRTHTLTFAGELGQMDSVDQPFAITASLQQKLAAEYRDRTLLKLLPEDITAVTIVDNGRRITIRRTENTYQTEDDDVELNLQAAANLFDTLSNLRVERYAMGLHIKSMQRTLTIERTTGEPITLNLTTINQTGTMSPSVADHQAWFTLDDATWEKLTASMLVDK